MLRLLETATDDDIELVVQALFVADQQVIEEVASAHLVSSTGELIRELALDDPRLSDGAIEPNTD